MKIFVSDLVYEYWPYLAHRQKNVTEITFVKTLNKFLIINLSYYPNFHKKLKFNRQLYFNYHLSL